MAKFIKLTEFTGTAVHLNIDLATFIRPEPDGSYAHDKGGRAMINILGSQGGCTFEVTETPEQILKLIEDAQ